MTGEALGPVPRAHIFFASRPTLAVPAQRVSDESPDIADLPGHDHGQGLHTGFQEGNANTRPRGAVGTVGVYTR